MRYFVGLLIALSLIVVLVVILFSGNSTKHSITSKSLTDYANTDAIVRLTTDGPITAPQNHIRLQISVGRSQATFQQYQGYDGAITNSQSYDNTSSSYYSFLRALYFAGFMSGNNNPALANSTGLCPLGQVYTVEIIQDGSSIQKYWATNCGGSHTYLGNLNLTLTLFQAQIPDYNTLTNGLNF